MTPERARAFVLPFGKHKGEPLGRGVRDDPGYLGWLAGLPDLAPTIRRAVGAILARPAEPETEKTP